VVWNRISVKLIVLETVSYCSHFTVSYVISRTGKTLLAKTLARFVNVPFVIADATTLTQASWWFSLLYCCWPIMNFIAYCFLSPSIGFSLKFISFTQLASRLVVYCCVFCLGIYFYVLVKMQKITLILMVWNQMATFLEGDKHDHIAFASEIRCLHLGFSS
jgi:uncharacterized membrane protein (Fun14 family)